MNPVAKLALNQTQKKMDIDEYSIMGRNISKLYIECSVCVYKSKVIVKDTKKMKTKRECFN